MRWTHHRLILQLQSKHSLSATGGACQEGLCAKLTPKTIVLPKLKFENSWKHIESFITHLMSNKDLDGRKGLKYRVELGKNRFEAFTLRRTSRAGGLSGRAGKGNVLSLY